MRGNHRVRFKYQKNNFQILLRRLNEDVKIDILATRLSDSVTTSDTRKHRRSRESSLSVGTQMNGIVSEKEQEPPPPCPPQRS